VIGVLPLGASDEFEIPGFADFFGSGAFLADISRAFEVLQDCSARRFRAKKFKGGDL